LARAGGEKLRRPHQRPFKIEDGVATGAAAALGVTLRPEEISDGIDRYGLVRFSIYAPGAGHFGQTFWRINWSQNYFSQLSDETGGESHYLGSEAPCRSPRTRMI
jgi:hypothetical protein